MGPGEARGGGGGRLALAAFCAQGRAHVRRIERDAARGCTGIVRTKVDLGAQGVLRHGHKQQCDRHVYASDPLENTESSEDELSSSSSSSSLSSSSSSESGVSSCLHERSTGHRSSQLLRS